MDGLRKCKATLFHEYKAKQRLFRSKVRAAERCFEYRKQKQLEILVRENCCSFWDAIRRVNRENHLRVTSFESNIS